MKEFMAITKALADPGRVRILLSLESGELCVCQITEMFGLAPSTVSKHLALLHQAGLVRSRKSERWVYYRLPGSNCAALVRSTLQLVKRSLRDCDEIIADKVKLEKVLRMDLQAICRRQCR